MRLFSIIEAAFLMDKLTLIRPSFPGGLNLGPDTVESMEGVFRRLRDLMLSGQRYTRVVQFELIRLYEIQQSLRALRWLDIRGRMRLGLQLTRVVVSVCVCFLCDRVID